MKEAALLALTILAVATADYPQAKDNVLLQMQGKMKTADAQGGWLQTVGLVGVRDSTECNGEAITNANDCEAAASTIGANYLDCSGRACNNGNLWPWWPAGCAYNFGSGNVWWNTHAQTNRHQNAANVCSLSGWTQTDNGRTCRGTGAWGPWGSQDFTIATLDGCTSLCASTAGCNFVQFQPHRPACHLYEDCSETREPCRNDECGRTLAKAGAALLQKKVKAKDAKHSAAPYVRSPRGDADCPAGYSMITDGAVCEAASQFLGETYKYDSGGVCNGWDCGSGPCAGTRMSPRGSTDVGTAGTYGSYASLICQAALNFIDAHASGLDLCQGDCDNDSDCQGSLVCFQRHGNDFATVPGCAGTPYADNEDYCVQA